MKTPERFDAKATVRFYKTEDGGRNGPTPLGWYKCPLKFNEEFFDCGMFFDKNRSILPGEKIEVELVFAQPVSVFKILRKQKYFQVWEVRIVGDGFVEKIYE